MAIYEYGCENCGTVVEVMKSIAKCDDEETCEDCGEVMEKLISQGSFKLVGGGWPGKALKGQEYLRKHNEETRNRKK